MKMLEFIDNELFLADDNERINVGFAIQDQLDRLTEPKWGIDKDGNGGFVEGKVIGRSYPSDPPNISKQRFHFRMIFNGSVFWDSMTAEPIELKRVKWRKKFTS